MLSRQDFGGGHQGCLVARRDRGVDGDRRHDCLPGADIPLEEAVHLVGPAQVRADLVDDPLLGVGQLEADLGNKFLDLIVVVEDL